MKKFKIEWVKEYESSGTIFVNAYTRDEAYKIASKQVGGIESDKRHWDTALTVEECKDTCREDIKELLESYVDMQGLKVFGQEIDDTWNRKMLLGALKLLKLQQDTRNRQGKLAEGEFTARELGNEAIM